MAAKLIHAADQTAVSKAQFAAAHKVDVVLQIAAASSRAVSLVRLMLAIYNDTMTQ